MSVFAALAGNTEADDGATYAKSVLSDVVKHPVLKILDPKEMIKFLTPREEYELKVEEKPKKVLSMITASFSPCVKPHVLHSMHFMGMSEKVGTEVPLAGLISDHNKQSIQEAVDIVRKKEPDAEVAEFAIVRVCMRMSIADPTMRVKQLVVDYLERMENIKYGPFKNGNPKKTVAHLTADLYPKRLKQIGVKDLAYRQNLNRDVKLFTKYVGEQAEHVDKSKDIDTGSHGTTQNDISRAMYNAGSSTVASKHKGTDAKKK